MATPQFFTSGTQNTGLVRIALDIYDGMPLDLNPRASRDYTFATGENTLVTKVKDNKVKRIAKVVEQDVMYLPDGIDGMALAIDENTTNSYSTYVLRNCDTKGRADAIRHLQAELLGASLQNNPELAAEFTTKKSAYLAAQAVVAANPNAPNIAQLNQALATAKAAYEEVLNRVQRFLNADISITATKDYGKIAFVPGEDKYSYLQRLVSTWYSVNNWIGEKTILEVGDVIPSVSFSAGFISTKTKIARDIISGFRNSNNVPPVPNPPPDATSAASTTPDWRKEVLKKSETGEYGTIQFPASSSGVWGTYVSKFFGGNSAYSGGYVIGNPQGFNGIGNNWGLAKIAGMQNRRTTNDPNILLGCDNTSQAQAYTSGIFGIRVKIRQFGTEYNDSLLSNLQYIQYDTPANLVGVVTALLTGVTTVAEALKAVDGGVQLYSLALGNVISKNSLHPELNRAIPIGELLSGDYAILQFGNNSDAESHFLVFTKSDVRWVSRKRIPEALLGRENGCLDQMQNEAISLFDPQSNPEELNNRYTRACENYTTALRRLEIGEDNDYPEEELVRLRADVETKKAELEAVISQTNSAAEYFVQTLWSRGNSYLPNVDENAYVDIISCGYNVILNFGGNEVYTINWQLPVINYGEGEECGREKERKNIRNPIYLAGRELNIYGGGRQVSFQCSPLIFKDKGYAVREAWSADTVIPFAGGQADEKLMVTNVLASNDSDDNPHQLDVDEPGCDPADYPIEDFATKWHYMSMPKKFVLGGTILVQGVSDGLGVVSGPDTEALNGWLDTANETMKNKDYRKHAYTPINSTRQLPVILLIPRVIKEKNIGLSDLNRPTAKVLSREIDLVASLFAGESCYRFFSWEIFNATGINSTDDFESVLGVDGAIAINSGLTGAKIQNSLSPILFFCKVWREIEPMPLRRRTMDITRDVKVITENWDAEEYWKLSHKLNMVMQNRWVPVEPMENSGVAKKDRTSGGRNPLNLGGYHTNTPITGGMYNSPFATKGYEQLIDRVTYMRVRVYYKNRFFTDGISDREDLLGSRTSQSQFSDLCLFTGLCLGGSVDTFPVGEDVKLECQDLMHVFEKRIEMNYPFYDGVYAWSLISDICMRAGVRPMYPVRKIYPFPLGSASAPYSVDSVPSNRSRLYSNVNPARMTVSERRAVQSGGYVYIEKYTTRNRPFVMPMGYTFLQPAARPQARTNFLEAMMGAAHKEWRTLWVDRLGNLMYTELPWGTEYGVLVTDDGTEYGPTDRGALLNLIPHLFSKPYINSQPGNNDLNDGVDHHVTMINPAYVIYGSRNIKRMASDCFTTIQIASVDAKSRNIILARDTNYAALAVWQSPGYIGFVKPFMQQLPALGGRKELRKHISQLVGTMYIPPYSFSVQTQGNLWLRPNDIVSIDWNLARITNVTNEINIAENNFWCNISAEWFVRDRRASARFQRWMDQQDADGEIETDGDEQT